MKLGGFLLLLVIQSAWAGQKTQDCDDPIGNMIAGLEAEELQKNADKVLAALPATGGLELKNCNAQESALLQRSHETAGQLTKSLLARIQKAALTDPQFQKPVSMLTCAQGKLPHTKITCKDLGGDMGRTIPFLGTGMAIDPTAIHGYYLQSLEQTTVSEEHFTAGTIVHELMHKCGASDAAYFSLPTDSLAQGNVMKIADTYQNWMLWGFCKPGPDCAKRPIPYRK